MDFEDGLEYDPCDERSILEHAAKLSGHTMREMEAAKGVEIIGGLNAKGKFGQYVEDGYFGLKNNSRPEPDFAFAGIELKVSPMHEVKKGLTAKERMVLGIIDYGKVEDLGFRIFTDKNSHILILFYLWHKDENIRDYRILKVVDWKPPESDLRIIREDWDKIERMILDGRADELSEKDTMLLAACTKGAGHGADLRPAPGGIMAKQRALSFKSSYVTTIFNESRDINEVLISGADPVDSGDAQGKVRIRRLEDFDDGPDYEPLIKDDWSADLSFEQYVLGRFQRFVGMDCQSIESELGIELSDSAKSYYHTLVLAMMGVYGKKHVREFVNADVLLKTVRLRFDGRSKESMSFPAFRYEEIVSQEWEDSDLYSQLDHVFFMPVFQFPGKDTDVGRKRLTFRGAFFWSIPDADFRTVQGVWEDTKDRIDAGLMDGFVKGSDDRISHVRPHARDSRDTFPFRGKDYTKKSFWLNADYIADVVRKNLGGPRSTR